MGHQGTSNSQNNLEREQTTFSFLHVYAASHSSICTKVLEHYSSLLIWSYLRIQVQSCPEKCFLNILSPQAEYPSCIFPLRSFPTIIAVVILIKIPVYCVFPYHVNSLENWDCVHQVHQFCLQHQSSKVSGKG